MRWMMFGVLLGLTACTSGPPDPTGTGSEGDTGTCETRVCGTAPNGEECGSCDDGSVCVEGMCLDEGCPDGLFECSAECVDLLTDVEHCGSCDYDCGTAEHGTIACESAECQITCDAGAIYCGGDDCSVCPDHATETRCDGGQCIATACEAGMLACGGTCHAIPEHTRLECDRGEPVVTGCDGFRTLELDDRCTCSAESGPGESTLESTTVGRPPAFCGTGSGPDFHVDDERVCGAGTWAIDVHTAPSFVRGIGRYRVEADCGALIEDRCDAPGSAFTLKEARVRRQTEQLLEGECLHVQTSWREASATPVRVDLKGPFETVDAFVVVRGTPIPKLSFSLPKGTATVGLDISRVDGLTYAEQRSRLIERHPSGEVFEYPLVFTRGMKTRTISASPGLFTDASVFEIEGSSGIYVRDFESISTTSTGFTYRVAE